MKIVVFVKTILTLDDVIPLLFQLREMGMIEPPLVVAWDGRALDYFRRNVVLSDAIKEMGGELVGINRLRSRWLSQLHNLWVLRSLFFTRHLLLETYPLSNKIAKFMVRLNRRLWGGSRVHSVFMTRPQRFARNAYAYYEAVREDFSRKEKVLLGYDYLLLSYDKEVHEEIHGINLVTDAKIVNVGYTRGLPAWRTYLDHIAPAFLQREISQPYFFFPLTAVGSGFVKGEDCISMTDKFRESLQVLKDYNDRILTVFKPHFKTDMVIVQRLLDEVGYRNYQISYLHPEILFRGARFTFCYHPTSVLVEAYYSGCPTIEYAHYDSRFFKLNGERPRYLEAIDHFSYRDSDKLRGILDKAVPQREAVIRDPQRLAEDFRVMNTGEIKRSLTFFVGTPVT